MRIKTDLPRQGTRLETWIPMSDGARLSATVWLPVDADADPVPAFLEAEPYRKNDLSAARDARHRYFAGHGYASVKIDLRGSGDSDGILEDEYLPREQEDCVEAIAWIAAQPWCTGKVGMWGISWSGFNSLQVAARRPPALAAIITLCSTDDRYADDVHYMGGCVIGVEMLVWASVMLFYNAHPPLPEVVGDRWRDMWVERIERTPPFVEAWLAHQRRDAFWKQGSVCEDYAAIEVPVYAVGGWADGYTNAIPRLLEHLPGVRKGLIGPWAHTYPHVGGPGPQIGFLQECRRWWDRWLKGVDNGIEREPPVRLWMQEAIAPAVTQIERPGRWVLEPAWPPPSVESRTFFLNETALEPEARAQVRLEQAGPLATALDAGIWCPHGAPGNFPGDQRVADGMSLSFTSAPLAERLEILGYPEVSLSVAADRPQALVAVRLCDVAPDGASTLISVGLLNLTHRDGHESEVKPLVPGERYEVTVRLNVIAYAVPAGHRLRVAVSPNYWPWAWPSPEPVTLSVYAGASTLSLPVRPSRPGEPDPEPFDEPETLEQPLPERIATGEGGMRIRRDPVSGAVDVAWEHSMGSIRLLGRGLELGGGGSETFSIVEGAPLSATVRCTHAGTLAKGDWRVRVETVSTMTSDATSFIVTNQVDAYEGDARVAAKTWTFRVPRDNV